MPHWWIEKQFIPVSLPGQFFPNSPPRALIFAILCLPRLLKSEPLSDWRTLDQNTSKYQLQQQQKYYFDFVSCVLWQQFILKILEASILSGVCKICNNSVCCRFSKLLQLHNMNCSPWWDPGISPQIPPDQLCLLLEEKINTILRFWILNVPNEKETRSNAVRRHPMRNSNLLSAQYLQ